MTPMEKKRVSAGGNSVQSVGMQSIHISTSSGAGRRSLMPGQSAFGVPPSAHSSGNSNSNSRASRASFAIRTDVIAEGIWQEQLRRQWASTHSPFEGIVIKKSRGDFVCAPPGIRSHRDGLFDMVSQLNVTVRLRPLRSDVASLLTT